MVRGRGANRVEVDITGNTDQAQSSVNNLRGGILGTLGSLGAAVTGIQSAFSLASSGINALIGPINAASEANLGLINTTNQYMALSGLGYDESRKALIDLEKQATVLGNTLPGVTDDYKTIAISITDNLIPAVKDLDGAFSAEGVNKYALELSKNFGFLAATTESTSEEIGLGLNRALTESVGLAQLRTLSAFQKNPALLAQIQTISEEMGLEFDKATTAQRVQILTKASEVSTEALEAAGEDISVLVSGIQARLFGSQGVFSFVRLIGGSGEVGDLGTNIVQELGTTLQTILDPSGPFASIWSLIGEINFDPMAALRDVIINFRENWLPRIADFVESLVSAFESGGEAGVINQISSMLGNLDFSEIGYKFGELMGNIVNYVVSIIGQIDFSFLAPMILNMSEGLGVAILAFAATVDWGNLVVTGFQVIIDRLKTFADFIGMTIAAAITGIGVAIGAVIQGTFNAAKNMIISRVNDIGKHVRSLVEIFQQIASAVSGVVTRVSGAVSAIKNIQIPGMGDSEAIPARFGGQFPGIMGAAIKESIAMPDQSKLVMANSSELILNQSQQRDLLNSMGSKSGGDSFTFNIQAIEPQMVAREVERLMRSKNRFA